MPWRAAVRNAALNLACYGVGRSANVVEVIARTSAKTQLVEPRDVVGFAIAARTSTIEN